MKQPPQGWVAWWYQRRLVICQEVVMRRILAAAEAAAKIAEPEAAVPVAPTSPRAAQPRAQRRSQKWRQ
jgi:hypothetical protein